MGIRIERRPDYSWLLGWVAVTLELLAGAAYRAAWIFRDANGNWVLPWWQTAVPLFGGAAIAILALCLAPLSRPAGRGWIPALVALSLAVAVWELIWRGEWWPIGD